MVELEKVSRFEGSEQNSVKSINSDLLDFDEARLKLIIQKHFRFTKSKKAKTILDNWNKYINLFHKITPFDFKRALIERKEKLNTNNNTTNRIAGE